MCPVCKNTLSESEKSYVCKNNHSFDVSKKGYVNLLMSNVSKEKRHGDDKRMISARTEFLEMGYYRPLAERISQIALEFGNAENDNVLFECGCGECYYLNYVENAFLNNNMSVKTYGMDISKEALPFGKKRMPSSTLFVGSAFKLPLMSESVDVALSIFAPVDMREMSRVIKKNGCLIKVIPLENHLIELKRELYENVYLNRPVVEMNENFALDSNEKVEYKFKLKNNSEINSLFKMTPYYYKTSVDAQQKLLALNELDVSVSFGVCKYVRL